MAAVDMRGDWLNWQPTEPLEVLKPEEEHEGMPYQIAPSKHGAVVRVHELRDPFAIMAARKLVIFFTGAGEMNIAGAELEESDVDN